MTTWKIDASHSEIKFKTRHLLISTVGGHFNKFEGTVQSDKPDFTDAQINFEADIDSISTNDNYRDGHLKSADFFDAVAHPKLFFKSKALNKTEGEHYNLIGDLTIRGITKEVTLNVELTGTTKGFGGVDVAGFELTGKINRFDFDLKWNALTETGGIALGETVKLELFIELTKVAAETPELAAA